MAVIFDKRRDQQKDDKPCLTGCRHDVAVVRDAADTPNGAMWRERLKHPSSFQTTAPPFTTTTATESPMCASSGSCGMQRPS